MYKCLVIGFSAGGIPLAKRLLQRLKKPFPLPVIIVGHLPEGKDSALADVLADGTGIEVHQVCDKIKPQPNNAYIAVPDYHLLMESPVQLSLSVDDPVSYVRPSIDVLFESAANVCEGKVIGVLLSGANTDGIDGLHRIKQLGGVTMVLHPDKTDFNTMPVAAIDAIDVDYICEIEEITAVLNEIEDTYV